MARAAARARSETSPADLAKALGIDEAKVESALKADPARPAGGAPDRRRHADGRRDARWPRHGGPGGPAVPPVAARWAAPVRWARPGDAVYGRPTDLRASDDVVGVTDASPLVLVVDDDDAIREALERALRLEGFAVETAAGGRAALESVARSARRPPSCST